MPAPRPASAWSMDGSPKRLGCAEMFEVIVLGDCSKLRKNQLDHRITKTNNISRNVYSVKSPRTGFFWKHAELNKACELCM